MKHWRTKLHGCEFRVTRLNEPQGMSPTDISAPDKAASVLFNEVVHSPQYREDRENMVLLFLNTRRMLISWEVHSNGAMDSVLVDMRLLFKPAIVTGAACLLLAHNHPSGIVTPSQEDVHVTRKVFKAGQLLGIEVVDHIIFATNPPSGEKRHVSLRELGYFYG